MLEMHEFLAHTVHVINVCLSILASISTVTKMLDGETLLTLANCLSILKKRAEFARALFSQPFMTCCRVLSLFR
jgi:hypothetical protein